MKPTTLKLAQFAALLAAIPAHGQQEAAQSDAGPALKLDVIEGVKVKLPDRSLYYRRVAPPPALPQEAKTAQPTPAPLTPEQLAIAERRAEKRSEVLMLSATVYDRRVTDLRWWIGNHEYRAWSNVDFNYLAGAGEIETEDACIGSSWV